MKKFYFESRGGEVISFSAVTATAPQREYKRIVHLRSGNFILLYGDDGDEFLRQFKDYISEKQQPELTEAEEHY